MRNHYHGHSETRRGPATTIKQIAIAAGILALLAGVASAAVGHSQEKDPVSDSQLGAWKPLFSDGEDHEDIQADDLLDLYGVGSATGSGSGFFDISEEATASPEPVRVRNTLASRAPRRVAVSPPKPQLPSSVAAAPASPQAPVPAAPAPTSPGPAPDPDPDPEPSPAPPPTPDPSPSPSPSQPPPPDPSPSPSPTGLPLNDQEIVGTVSAAAETAAGMAGSLAGSLVDKGLDLAENPPPAEPGTITRMVDELSLYALEVAFDVYEDLISLSETLQSLIQQITGGEIDPSDPEGLVGKVAKDADGVLATLQATGATVTQTATDALATGDSAVKDTSGFAGRTAEEAEGKALGAADFARETADWAGKEAVKRAGDAQTTVNETVKETQVKVDQTKQAVEKIAADTSAHLVETANGVPGALQEIKILSINVDSSSPEGVYVPVIAGQTYRVRASGVFTYAALMANSQDFMADAECSIVGDNALAGVAADRVWKTSRFLDGNRDLLDLQYSGLPNVAWKPVGPTANGCSLSHEYEVEITTSTQLLRFNLLDQGTGYADNLGSITLDVYQRVLPSQSSAMAPDWMVGVLLLMFAVPVFCRRRNRVS